MESLEHLSFSLLNTKWADYSEETIKSAKLVLLDTLGSMIAGIHQKESYQLAKQLNDVGSFRMLGTELKTNLYDAGFVHGIAAVGTEMDEGNQFSKGHPAAHVVPVLLTLYQQYGKTVSGETFMDVLIKGYEACSRFGRATTLLPDAHAHGTWGVMGAAATALLMENVSLSDFCEGVQLSATFALPTMWTAALKGKLIRNVYAGHAIEMGIRTVSLLKSNHLAPENNISHVFASVIGTNFDYQELIRKENEPWDIELNYFKPYAFCRYAHAPIDAFVKIVETYKLKPEEIERVNVYTYSRAATLANQNYNNILSCKFSIPYALSVWAYKNVADQTVFSNEYIEDRQIEAFAKRVFVHNSEELERDYPKTMPAVVEVLDCNGNIYKERIDIAKGGPGKNLTELEIIKKFMNLTNNYYSENIQNEIINFILEIEHKTDISKLFQLCTTVKGDS
ncbi:MmgE/PrpD family protein [Calidifontibacillus oryziterrae]|uniref:MmgE/PrpD family protein n=1 Tax=Calidifontibacillus oryziterrae TaxID=1191699 RepID=UPI0002EBD32F|nr:MmgE/PrpD family protein [Calidifontibacillus oryziterrae]